MSGSGELPFADESADAVFSYITMQLVPTRASQKLYFAEAIRICKPGGWVLMQYRRTGPLPWALDWAGHSAHLLYGRKTFHPAWRGARVKQSALRSYGSDNLSVELRRLGKRHLWALARKSRAAG